MVQKYLEKEFNYQDIKKDIRQGIDAAIPTEGHIMQFLREYSEFNYVFAGCVSALAGKFQISPTDYKHPVLEKVSHLVAKNVFEAAIGEFYGDKTHKSISNYMIDHAGDFFGEDSKGETHMSSILESVKDGYGIGHKNNLNILARNLGFHIASEQLASFEFKYLSDKIRVEYSKFYEYMNESVVGASLPPFGWITIQGNLGEVRAGFAYKAADVLLDAAEDVDDKYIILQSLKRGFEFFIKVQKEFFDNVNYLHIERRKQNRELWQ